MQETLKMFKGADWSHSKYLVTNLIHWVILTAQGVTHWILN